MWYCSGPERSSRSVYRQTRRGDVASTLKRDAKSTWIDVQHDGIFAVHVDEGNSIKSFLYGHNRGRNQSGTSINTSGEYISLSVFPRDGFAVKYKIGRTRKKKKKRITEICDWSYRNFIRALTRFLVNSAILLTRAEYSDDFNAKLPIPDTSPCILLIREKFSLPYS